MLRDWQGPKTGREVGGGEGGQEGGGMATRRGRQGGGIWKGAMRRGRWGGEQQGREEGGNGEGDNVRRRWRRGNRELGKGKEMGIGRRRGKRRGDFTDGYNGMGGWT